MSTRELRARLGCSAGDKAINGGDAAGQNRSGRAAGLDADLGRKYLLACKHTRELKTLTRLRFVERGPSTSSELGCEGGGIPGSWQPDGMASGGNPVDKIVKITTLIHQPQSRKGSDSITAAFVQLCMASYRLPPHPSLSAPRPPTICAPPCRSVCCFS